VVKPSTVSTGNLKTFRSVQLRPINRVVYPGSFGDKSPGNPRLGIDFTLRCFQRLFVPDIATQRCRERDNWYTRGPSFQILSYYGRGAVKIPTPTADRDRPGSRRSEPSSRTTLIGEQPNPWDRLQPQDVMSRHRGAKPHRRYGRSDAISLLSPAYLLSVELWPFHTGPQDHLGRLSSLLVLSDSQSSRLLPIRSTTDCQPV
jgi:hypothetical protein